MEKIANKTGVEKRPEFYELIDEFREELMTLGENSNSIYHKVNMIKDLTEPEKELAGEQLPEGILGELWGCLRILKEHNQTLRQAKRSLTEFIG